MLKNNLIADKSYLFALKIIKVNSYLTRELKEYIIAKQLLRCGTLIGANVREAIGAQSRPDFISKMSIAYKESLETEYWLSLLKDSKILPIEIAEDLLVDCIEICRIIAKIQLTTKNNDELIN